MRASFQVNKRFISERVYPLKGRAWERFLHIWGGGCVTILKPFFHIRRVLFYTETIAIHWPALTKEQTSKPGFCF